MSVHRLLIAVLFIFSLTACSPWTPSDFPMDGEQPYDDEPIVDAGPEQDSGSAPVVTQDAGTQERDGSTAPVDASPPKLDASIGTHDAAPVTCDDGCVPDTSTPDADVTNEAGTAPDSSLVTDSSVAIDAATTDAGGIIFLPPVDAGSPPKPNPYLERSCSAPVDCASPYELPKEPNVYTMEAPLCVAAAGAATGLCSFYCSYHTVIDGKDVWVQPAKRHETCTKMGGVCVEVGLDRLCLPMTGAR